MKIPIKIVVIVVMLFASPVQSAVLDQEAVDLFIDEMVQEHGFNRNVLQDIFRMTRKSQRVLDAIQRPAEALPWYKYRDIFIRPSRIDQGLQFWQENREALNRAESTYGVPPQIIVAIIGVETSYGRVTGNDRVVDALATLAFHYPRRGSFFRKQLKEYLLLAREQAFDPLLYKGSYAGAMGIPQFIPSSFREYAIDFDHDDKIDIWNNPTDAIGSVANYFHKHHWVRGDRIVIPATVSGGDYQQVLNNHLELHMQVSELERYNIQYQGELEPAREIKLLQLESINGNEYWLALKNFYVITRYNHSALYAMAVYQLSEKIRNGRQEKIATFE